MRMKKESLPKTPYSLAIALVVLIVTFSTSCKSTKIIGATEIKPVTYPSAHGYGQKPLGFSYSALQPFIGANELQEHYQDTHSHHLNKLNKIIFAHESMMGKSLEELLQNVSKLPADIKGTFRESGGAHWNHTFFWEGLTAKKNTYPAGELKKAITSKWGSIEKFKKKFEKDSKVKYGQCWVWLVSTEKGLKISMTHNYDNPLMDIAEIKGKPIMAIDMWTHSFVDKDAKVVDKYLANFWEFVDWERASKLFNK